MGGRPIRFLALASKPVPADLHDVPDEPGFRTLVDAINAIYAAIANQEHVRLKERTKAGLAKVQAKGKTLGRPSASIHANSIAALRNQGKSNRAIACKLQLSLSTVAKYAPISNLCQS